MGGADLDCWVVGVNLLDGVLGEEPVGSHLLLDYVVEVSEGCKSDFGVGVSAELDEDCVVFGDCESVALHGGVEFVEVVVTGEESVRGFGACGGWGGLIGRWDWFLHGAGGRGVRKAEIGSRICSSLDCSSRMALVDSACWCAVATA